MLNTEELMLSNCGAGEDFESTLDCKEIKSVNPKEMTPEYSLEWLLLKLQNFWLPDAKSRLIVKTLMLEKVEGKKEKGVTENEMVR